MMAKKEFDPKYYGVWGALPGGLYISRNADGSTSLYNSMVDETLQLSGGGSKVKAKTIPGMASTSSSQDGNDKWLHSAWKMNKGGLVRGCGAAIKGKTRGKMV